MSEAQPQEEKVITVNDILTGDPQEEKKEEEQKPEETKPEESKETQEEPKPEEHTELPPSEEKPPEENTNQPEICPSNNEPVVVEEDNKNTEEPKGNPSEELAKLEDENDNEIKTQKSKENTPTHSSSNLNKESKVSSDKKRPQTSMKHPITNKKPHTRRKIDSMTSSKKKGVSSAEKTNPAISRLFGPEKAEKIADRKNGNSVYQYQDSEAMKDTFRDNEDEKKINNYCDPKFDSTIKRMNENMIKHHERMKKMEKEIKEQEQKKYVTVNNGDSRSNKEKLKSFDEKVNKMLSKQKETVKKERELRFKKIEKDKQMQEKMKNKPKCKVQGDFPKSKKDVKERKVKIDQNKFKLKDEHIQTSINHMMEWEKKRNERISSKRLKSQESEKREITSMFKPTLDKRSKNLAKKRMNNSTDDAFERLYREDVEKRKEKKEMLQRLNEPKFKPMVNKKGIRIQTRNLEINDYEDFMTNDEIGDMIRNRIMKKKY